MRRTMGMAAAVVVAAMALVLVGARAPREVEAASLSVFSPADSGPGSFRAAIEQANSNPSINVIVLRNLLPITLTSTVKYTGTQALTIQGDNPLLYRTIQGSLFVPGDPESEPLDCGMFRSTGGADITFQQVTIQNSWCDALNIAPVAGDNEIVITLNKVALRNNFGSGLFLHEIEEAEGAIRLHVTSSLVTGNGRCRGAAGCAFGGIELQGVGQGGISAQISGSAFNGNGGDGLSVVWDEAEVTTTTPPPLDVDLTVAASDTSFSANGGSAGFTTTASESGGRGGPSIATHQEGNGLTVAGDALGTGSVSVTLNRVQALGNAVHGIDILEESEGDVDFDATGLVASSNGSGGVRVRESGEGYLTATLKSSSTSSNEDSGVRLEGEDDGNFTLTVEDSSSNWNGGDGYHLSQEGGSSSVAVQFLRTRMLGNGRDGLFGDDSGAGAFSVVATSSTVVGNVDAAVYLEASAPPATFTNAGSFILGPIELVGVTQLP